MRKLLLVVVAIAAMAAMAIPAFAATKTVLVKDNFFSPKTTTISKGTTVRWVWKGQAPHNVTMTKGPGTKFRSKTKLKGAYQHTFKRAGSYTIICTIHPGMKLALKVK
jgi:plastocyanin